MKRDYDTIAQELVDLGQSCKEAGMPKDQIKGAIQAGLMSYELSNAEKMKVARILIKKKKAGEA